MDDVEKWIALKADSRLELCRWLSRVESHWMVDHGG